MSKLDDLRKKYGTTGSAPQTTGGTTKLEQLRQKYATPTASYQHSVSPSVRQETGIQGTPVRYNQITNDDVQKRHQEEMKKHQEKIRAIELQQKTLGKESGFLASGAEFTAQLSKQKQDLLKTPPSAEQAKKTLYAEQGKQMLKDDPMNDTAWMQFLANKLDPMTFQQYQTNPEYQKVIKASYLPEIEHEKVLEQTKAKIDEELYFIKNDTVKSAVQALRDFVLDTKGTLNTLDGMLGGNTYNMRKIEMGREVTPEEIGQSNAQANLKLQKGAEQFQQSSLNREAVVGGDSTRQFLYDLTKIAPDMLISVGMAIATGGGSVGAQMSAKEIAKSIMKKESREAALKALGKGLAVNPSTMPMGAKIFAQSYQGNLADGMDEGKAFFTAFVNAYGQSVLEGGGVQKAVAEGGMAKAVDFLKASMGEGFEEIKQNWWEGAVDKIVGGKDVPFYAQGLDQEGIINPARDAYSFALGAAAGGVGGAVKAPGAIKAYVDTKTKPKVEYENPLPKLEQYEGDVKKYEADLAAYEKRKNAPTVEPKGKPLTHTEQIERAKEIAPDLLQQEIDFLEQAALDVDGMTDAEAFEHNNMLLDMASELTEADIVQWVVNKEAPQRILDSLGTKTPEVSPQMAKLKDAKVEEPMEPTAPVEPDLGPKIDTSKMNKKVLAKMQDSASKVSEQSEAIADLARLGFKVSEIADQTGADVGSVRAHMVLNGIPVNPKSRSAWSARTAVADTVVSGIQLNADRSAPIITADEAETRMRSIPVLKNATVAQDLGIGHTYVQKLGKKLGIDVVFYNGGPEAAEGMYTAREGRTVFINRNEADNGKATMRIVGHEFTHSVKQNHPELYKALRDVVGDTMTTEKVGKLLDRYKLDPEYQAKLAEDTEALIEEMLADEAGSLFTDKTFWNNVYAKDATTAQKLVKLLRDLLNRILGTKEDSGNLGIMTEMQIKEFQKKFEDAVAGIMKNAETIALSDVFVETEGAVAPKFSLKTYKDSDVKAIEEGLVTAGFDRAKTKKYLQDLLVVAKKIESDPETYDYIASEAFIPLKDNSDKLYSVSLDFSTLCKKRYALQATLDAIHKRKGSMLTPEEIWTVRNALSLAGVEVSCGACYVDSARLKESDPTNQLLENWEGGITRKLQMKRYRPSEAVKEQITKILNGRTMKQISDAEREQIDNLKQAEWPELTPEELAEIRSVDPNMLLTADGKTEMAEKHPKIYELATTYIREKSHAKSVQGRSEYAPGMLQGDSRITKAKIAALNQNAGMRWQSWSDFEIPHLIDAMQAIGDMAQMGLKGHMYTKVPDAVYALGDTGMMLNLSLIPRGTTGFNENGELDFDPVEGMSIEDAQMFRTLYPNTAGTIAIGINNKHILAMMADPRIDYIIPYHASGLSKKLRQLTGTGFEKWLDYTGVQNEKGDGKSPLLLDWWDYSKTGNENVINYLNLVKERKLKPKFFGDAKTSNFLLNSEGEKLFNEGKKIKVEHVRDGAWKLLIDRKMFNGDKPIVQQAVKPEFNTKELEKIMAKYTGDHNKKPVHQGTVDAFFSGALTTKTTQIMTKFKVSNSEAEIGAQALNDLTAKFSTKRAKTIARDYTKKFLSDGKVSLVGKKIDSLSELAVMAQVYRDPRFETLRYIFVDEDGKILYHTGVTSRLPGASLTFAGDNLGKYIQTEWGFAASKGAKGYYMLHNHPSGNPKPSAEDINMTQQFARAINMKMHGHVIVNSNKYATIDGDGNIETLDLNNVDKLLVPDKAHRALGTQITGPEKLAEVGKMLQTTEGYSSIVYLSPGNIVRGIQEVPNETAKSVTKIKNFIKNNSLDFGGAKAVLVSEDSDVKSVAEYLIKHSWLLDAVDPNSAETIREKGVDVMTLDGQYHGKTLTGQEVKFSLRKEALEKAFKDSKVRGKDGKLLPVFHGTSADFTVFDKSKGGSYTGAKSAKLGFFFTDSKEMADTYRSGDYDYKPVKKFLSSLSDEQLIEIGERVWDVDENEDGTLNRAATIKGIMQSMADPYGNHVDKGEGRDYFKEFIEEIEDRGFNDFNSKAWEPVRASFEKGYGSTMELYLNITNPFEVKSEAFPYFDEGFYTDNITKAKAEGHDGVIFRDVSDAVVAFDAWDSPMGDVYVAFEPNQIKSPEGELEVNLENDDVRFSTRKDYGMDHHIGYYPDEISRAHDISRDNLMIPKNVYEHPEWYFDMRDPATKQSWAAVLKIRNNPNAKVKIYRGVPGFANEFNEGDWISLSPIYAKGETREGGKVISKMVNADEIVWDGNSINEFAYFSREEQKRIESEGVKYSIGHHAGDLGKAEYFGNQVGSSRGTGHFGTGTYFVGNKAKIEIGGYKDRPQHEVEFDGYNLFKPANYEDGRALHDALKYLNTYYRSSRIKVPSTAELRAVRDEEVDVIVETLRKYDLLDEEAFESQFDMTVDAYLESEEGVRGAYPFLVDQVKDAIRTSDYVEDSLISRESFAKTSEKLLGVSKEKALKLADEVWEEIEAQKEDFYYDNLRKTDSPSTRFMKKLGYEGVDVRHIDRLDNTEYGSVIYDLKPLDKYKIKAYHGTPHDFDKFSTEAIGTGEGAQAYGWGLYFAGNKSIAEWYKEVLAKNKSRDWEIKVPRKDGNGEDSLVIIAYGHGHTAWSFAKMTVDTIADLDATEETLEGIIGVLDEEITQAEEESRFDDLEELTSFREDLTENYDTKLNIQQPNLVTGRLFEVDLAPEEEHLLDYDNLMKKGYVVDRIKSAFEGSKEKYLAARKKRMDFPIDDEEFNAEYHNLVVEENDARRAYNLYERLGKSLTGKDIYRMLSELLGSDKEASMFLNSIGVPGLRYLNGPSRGKGTGSHNYVMFDDAAVEVLDKYSVKRETTGKPSIEIILDEKKGPVDLHGKLKDTYRRVVDKNAPIVSSNTKAGKLASNAALVSGTLEWIADRALVDSVGKTVDKSLKATVKPFATNKDFWMYMAQKHNIDRAREGKPVDPSMSPEQSAEYVSQVDKQHPEYKAWADSVTGWIDQFMKTWAVDTGIIDADTYSEWRQMYPSYFPTYREFSDLEGGGNYGPGKRFVDLPSPVKKATGSDRDITNPVGNILQMMNKVIRTARYNDVGKALLESADGTYAEVIPPSIGMFSKLDNVVTVWVDGQPQYLQINDKMLLEAITGLPRIINNAVAVRRVTSVFKGLVTQYNPLFAIRNMFRDIPTAYVYGSQDNPLFFLSNLVKAGYQVATKTGGAAQYMAMGGAGSGQFSADSAAQYAKLLQPSATKNPLIRGAKGVLKGIEFVNSLTEQAPRVAEFNYVLEKTGNVDEALYAAQNVTVNFARGGDVTKQIEPFVPYLNASVQGLDRFFQAFNFKKDPKGALKRMVKAGIAVTAPQLVSYMIGMADDEEKYKALDQRTKDSYYVFPKGDGTYWKIPKSRELSVLFGSLFERALAGNFKGFGQTVATNFTPVDPFTNNLAAPLVFNLPMNKDFAGRAIVPQYMLSDGRSPKLQYDDNTSEIAKKVGELANLSPKQVDYIIRSYTGVVGQFLLPATTARSGAGNAIERMTVGAFTADPVFSSQAVTDFYDKLGELQATKTDRNLKENLPSKMVTMEERMYTAMNKVASNISMTTKYINANLKANDPKVRELKGIVNGYVDKANKAKTLADIVRINAEMKAALIKAGVR